MIKELLRKYILEFINEADPMGHFNKRVSEVVDNIINIKVPENVYINGVSKKEQDEWIISQLKIKIKEKINKIINTKYPIGKRENIGICVLVPLGMLKLQPLKGNPVSIMVTAEREKDTKTGMSYYIGIYDNRMPTFVLADPNIPSNKSPLTQLQAHIKNNAKEGWPINIERSYVDKSFANNVVVDMADFPIPEKEEPSIDDSTTTVGTV